MKSVIKPSRVLAAVIVVCVALVLVSWDYKQTRSDMGRDQRYSDTIPKKADRKAERKIRDLDEAIAELDNVNIDAEIGNAMVEVQKALKDLDFDKMQVDLNRSLKEIDGAKIQAEVKAALASIDADKLCKEISASLKEINWDEFDADMAKIADIKVDFDSKSLQKEMEQLGPQLKKGLEDAKVEIEKAKAKLKAYKYFVDDLDKEGLINKKENYQIEHKDGKLFVNGKEASREVYKRHETFLKQQGDFNLKKEDDDFNIDDLDF